MTQKKLDKLVSKSFKPVAMNIARGNAYDYWIRLMAEVEGQNKYSRITTKKSNISTVIEFDDERSLLVLDNGMQIPVKMNDLDLLEKIDGFAPGKKEKHLDLTGVTGDACEPVKPVKITETFKKPSTEGVTGTPHEWPIEITLYVHRSENIDYKDRSIKDNYKIHSFMDAQIDKSNTNFNSSYPMYLEMKSHDGAPFADEYGCYVDMEGEDLLEAINLARLTGKTVIDLREHTRLKDYDHKVETVNGRAKPNSIGFGR